MKGFSEKKIFTEKAKGCLKLAIEIVDLIDHTWRENDQLRCHEVARVVHKILK